jgi:hypothetical protein
MAPAFLVAHQPGSPLVKSSPSSLAWGSFFAFLQPACDQAEIVVINLHKAQRWVIQSIGYDVREKESKGSARSHQDESCTILLHGACKRVNLSNFSLARGTSSKKRARNIPSDGYKEGETGQTGC